MGELNAARHIAKTPKANANSWCEMKKVLPLLAKEQRYKYLKSGKGRGGEAVIMIENVRIHADIANRHERPDHLSKRVKKKATTGGLSHPLWNVHEPEYTAVTR